ncbi:MAG TPA: trypsin-like peptidase domain-containing protein [Candidatus Limnocylindria bacterium]|nr:trypsin-like peptidase domain-containing protein [Candidatus Limnocylindria bacterium]
MTDTNQPTDRDPTQPVEVQHYGPAPEREYTPSGNDAPAWTSKPPERAAPTRTRGGVSAAPLVAVAVVAGIVSGALTAVGVNNLMDRDTASVPAASGSDASPVRDVTIDESSAVISAVNKVAPAVVTIRSQVGGILGNASGSGSGFIYDPSGFILTNKHVVEDANELVVILNDGRQFPATVYGIDTLTDLAIVKIEADADLPYAPIGSSAGLEPGQLAIAIGNPLGEFENTVTTGVVSGLGRQIAATNAVQSSSDVINNLIQTDAAINPGNSGGPLVNSSGQVIGINTAVSESAQGLGFAIPIDFAKPIMQQALDGQQLSRPWIGIYYTPITPALADEQNLSVDQGALVASSSGQPAVFPGSPAETAGVQDGDIIVAIDGEQITADTDLQMMIVPHKVGDTITLRVLRGNSTQEIDVTLGELPQR